MLEFVLGVRIHIHWCNPLAYLKTILRIRIQVYVISTDSIRFDAMTYPLHIDAFAPLTRIIVLSNLGMAS